MRTSERIRVYPAQPLDDVVLQNTDQEKRIEDPFSARSIHLRYSAMYICQT